MRLIKTIWDHSQAIKIERWLKSQRIQVELQPYPQPSPTCWRIWILEEEAVIKAKTWLEEIEKGTIDIDQLLADLPQAIDLEIEKPLLEASPPKSFVPYLTYSLAAFLVFLHLLIELILPPFQGKILKSQLLIDLPIKYQEFWPGFYSLTIKYFSLFSYPSIHESSLFSRFREGDFWRLWSPSFIHANWIHLLFNLSWLFPLSSPLEQKIGRWRLIGLIGLVGMCSNICQYLVGGYQFLGFSGIVTGMAGFIFARKRYYPWENYKLAPNTFTFIKFYLLLTLSLQIVSFILELLGLNSPEFGVANTAHLTGLLTGWLIGSSRWAAKLSS
jgi:membrane associated rhomboid family serine protease